MYVRAIVVVVTALLLCPGAQAEARNQAPGPEAVTLSGIVRDEGRLPLPGATVSAETPQGTALASTQSGPDGSWTLAGLPAGSVRVIVRLAGFRTAAQTVTTAAGAAPIAITLALAGYTDAVTVTASREERELASVPASVSVIAGDLLAQAPGVNLVESLTFVPGVTAGDVSGVDDLRISIRGAGVRAGFGSRGVIVMVDGVPVTEPDGQTPHMDGQIDLASAERIEVVRGPASALYGGAALGGVVNVVTRVPAREPRVTVRAEGGAYEFGKLHTAASRGAGPLIVAGTLSYTHLDGFRAHNSLRNWVGTGRASWTHGRSRFQFSALATDAELELPGTLDRQQFADNPTQVRPIYETNDWGRENRLVRAGGTFQRHWDDGQTLEIGSFGQVRDLFHPIFVVIDQDAVRYIGNARYRLARGSHSLAAGADVDVQWVDDRWFVNAGGRPGFRIRNDENRVGNAGLYLQDEITLGGRASLTAGVRADWIRYALVDRQVDDGDASDRRSFTRVSPKLGVTARLSDRLIGFANMATGFEAPTLGEVRLPAGFNEMVEPQTSVSVEGGVRGDIGSASFDVAIYRMNVEDEILPETVDNVTVYRNVARATHTGLELSLRSRTFRGLLLEGTYAWTRFILDEFDEASGNRLPGVPEHAGTVRASWSHASGWDGSASLVLAGRTFVNDANTESADRYAVVSATAGFRTGHVRVFVRAENLGDAQYTSRPQVNDTGGFYYYPAPGRHASAGVELSW
jgi:iron complex outermembrane receptor protein